MTILHGDCLDILPTLDPDSIDAIVTDPPYGLSFMGRDWDHGIPGERFWSLMLRVSKPGAHLLAFGGTRTYHRLACAIEDAGWEVRDCLVWAYASGFPKSLDVSKAMDKAAGATREVVGEWNMPGRGKRSVEQAYGLTNDSGDITAPATDLAREWQGWGTALKPAWEPIILARKPLRGTVARNVEEYGTGALNIDGCRIATDDVIAMHHGTGNGGPAAYIASGKTPYAGNVTGVPALGRWPANLILTDPLFDGGVEGVVGGGRTGIERGSTRGAGGQNGRYGPLNATGEVVGYGDSGTYSRFFLIPKASRSDREPKGEHGLELRERADQSAWCQVCPECGARFVDVSTGMPKCGHGKREWVTGKPRANTHPTVKPTALMRHLVRLVTPPGGVVLDPFLGSGTTAVACEEEGFDCIGIEREAEYVKIAEARLAGVARGLGIA